MGRLLLDPYVLALPCADSAEVVAGYVGRLLGLSELHDLGVCDILLTNTAGEVLDRTGSYPLWDALVGPAAGYRTDIVRVVYGFLERLRTLEDAAGVNDLLLEGCVTEPCELLTKRAEEFIQAYHRTLALAYVLNDCTEGNVQDTILFSSGLGTDEPQTISGRGQLLMVEWADPGGHGDGVFPRPFSVSLVGVTTVRGVSEGYAPSAVWARGLFREAVDLAVVQRQPPLGGASNQWPRHGRRWALGADFPESVARLSLDRDTAVLRALLEACAETVLGDALTKTHRLRVGEGGAAPPRIRARDGAVGWRRDITREFHLHYWATPDGPEIVCVVPHNDFGIPE